MRHFLQLPNKTVDLLSQEFALKNGEIAFEFGGVEKVLVTETALQNALAGMTKPVTLETKDALNSLTNNDVVQHQRIFVKDDGDGKWAYYMVTTTEGETPTFIKVSDEDIFGSLFSDDVTAQISKIGKLSNLKSEISVNLTDPTTIIEAINEVYNQFTVLKTKIGSNENLTTNEKGTLVGALNELVVDISTNKDGIISIQNDLGDKSEISLAEADKDTFVKALNKIITTQNTKLDSDDVVPIIVSYTGLLTELSTENQNSLVEAINEIVVLVNSNNENQVSVTGALSDLVTETQDNIVSAINELHMDAIKENEARVAAENIIVSNLNDETTNRIANEGDLSLLSTEEKTNLVGAINEILETGKSSNADLNTKIDDEIQRAIEKENVLDTKIDTSVANLVNGAPELLDTLGELSAAIGNDENFATTVANDIANAKAELRGAASEAMDSMKEIEDAFNKEITDRSDADTLLDDKITVLDSKLDSTANSLNTNIENVRVAVGLNEDNTYKANTNTSYIADATNTLDATTKLDTAIKSNSDALTTEIDRAKTAEQANVDAIKSNSDALSELEVSMDVVIGDTALLTTDSKDSVVDAINEVDAHSDVNTVDISTIKSFISSLLSKATKTFDMIEMIADTAKDFDISDMASTNVTVSIYSVNGTILTQEYGMLVDIDTDKKTVAITSAIDLDVRVVITSDISSLVL